ncbi:protein C-terminal S-isoprenylcysteine carboxyl O-methyltransferase [Abeliophyllum distichum]|uniref:Protein C-terminal S-isoprenylcysteine carboxyl O-methyltransferase n=1 Tax=Abeliophyllum distichum TaxID=126358 RepID=A0ABD1P157_9LAMI
MEAATSLVCSKVSPFGFTFSPKHNLMSFRHFNKQVKEKDLSVKISLTQKNIKLNRTPLNFCVLRASKSGNPPGLSLKSCENSFHLQSFSPLPLAAANSRVINRLHLLRCSYSSSDTTSAESSNPFLKSLRNFNFVSLKSTLLRLSPVDICKWCLIFSIAIAASKWSLNLLFNPFFWTYFSWTWLFWPWLVAIGLAIYSLYSLNKHLRGEASVLEQLAIVTSAFTWLTLVPPAHFNGFLEGWPFVFFFVYHYFFFLNVSVRKRLYGDYYPRKHDTKWDISLPNWHKLLFCVGVMVGHWLAACEGTELHLIPGGWNNVGIWLLIMLTVFMQYHSTLYLAKYSEKVVVPTAVVQFGPYRFIRHPIYASTMLLFVTYFTALRAPMSALFIVAVCFMYYEQKAKLEEALMLETFGERYTEYMQKVRYKFLPFVY